MRSRANWKGFLKIAEVTCPVALFAAAAASERIVLHTINRATGHRVHRQFVDAATGAVVEREDQVKGYEVAKDEYAVLEPDEVAAAVPQSDKTLSVSAFVDLDGIDDVYFDRPYYLAPSDKSAEEAFDLIREGMRAADVAAIAQTVLFRRVRTLMIRASGAGLVATTLNFDYEVRSARQAFAEVPRIKVKGEMLDLAKHIIVTKQGVFDPAKVHDRYEAALADLVKAKLEGKTIAAPKAPQRQNRQDLMAALRESAGQAAKAANLRAKSKVAPAGAVRAKAGVRKKAS